MADVTRFGQWRKAQVSTDQGGNCVEVAAGAGGAVVGVRDSKDLTQAPIMLVPADWEAFKRAAST